MNTLIKRILPITIVLAMCIFVLTLQANATIVKVLDDQVSVTDSANSNTVSNGVVTIKASGSLFGKKTNNITIKNETDSTAQVKFDYTASTYSSFTIAGASASASGTHTVMLDAGGTLAMVLVSNSGFSNTTATLKLSNFSFTVAAASSDVTFTYDSSLGSVTVDGTAVSDGDVKNISSSGAALVATPKSGASFLGWIDGSNAIWSTSASYTLNPTKAMTVRAVFATDTAWFSVGKDEYLYNNLNQAATKAASLADKTVVLINNGTLSANADNPDTTAVETVHTIPSGVTLLIPYESSHSTADKNNSTESSTMGRSVFRTLTLADGCNLQVDGTMIVNGEVGYAWARFMGIPINGYGCVDMKGSSTITVNGILKVRGEIRGDNKTADPASDTAAITVSSGATVYQLLQIMDFRGGIYAKDNKDEGVFIVNQIFIQNIQVSTKYAAKSTLKGQYFVYAGTGVSGEIAVISNSDDSLFKLESGSVYFSYLPDTSQTVVDFSGTGALKHISVNFAGQNNWGFSDNFTMDTKNSQLPLSHALLINVKDDAVLDVDYPTKLLPGCVVTIDEGGTVNLNSSLYLYDTADYVQGKDGYGLGYYPMRANSNVPEGAIVTRDGSNVIYDGTNTKLLPVKTVDGSLIVNGTLNIKTGGALYTSASTNLQSNNNDPLSTTESTGIIVVEAASSATSSLKELHQSSSTIPEISFTAAKGLYASTNTIGDIAGTTGTYISNGSAWYNWKVTVNDGIRETYLYMMNGDKLPVPDDSPCYYSDPERTVEVAAGTAVTSDMTLYLPIPNADVTLLPSEYCQYTFGDYTMAKDADSAHTMTLKQGTNITLSVEVPEGKYFYGWRINGTEDLWTETSKFFTLLGDMTVYPVILDEEPTSLKPYKVDDLYFDFWEDAVDYALNEAIVKMVIINRDHTLPTTFAENAVSKLGGTYVTPSGSVINYIVPEGVTLLVPYDETGFAGDYSEPKESDVAFGADLVRKLFRTLTVSDGCNIQVDGTMNVNGIACYGVAKYYGVSAGPYALVDMKGNSTITVNGTLKARGEIHGDWNLADAENGTAAITVNSGATVYQLIEIMDQNVRYNTATDSGAYFATQMFVQNIQVGTKYAANSKLIAQSFASAFAGEVPIISNDDTGLFKLTDGNIYFSYIWDTSRTVVDFDGTGALQHLAISVNSSTKYDTKDSQLPLTHAFHINVKDGAVMDVTHPVKLLPGCVFTIEEGGTVNLNSSMYLYDAADYLQHRTGYSWSYYPIMANTNSPTGQIVRRGSGNNAIDGARKLLDPTTVDGSLVVNGTLNINADGRLYTSTGTGANENIPLYTTKRTGRIVVKSASDSEASLTEIKMSEWVQKGDTTHVKTTTFNSAKGIHATTNELGDIVATAGLTFKSNGSAWYNWKVTVKNGVTDTVYYLMDDNPLPALGNGLCYYADEARTVEVPAGTPVTEDMILYLHKHVDVNSDDHKCDICGETIHTDSNSDFVCDFEGCGMKLVKLMSMNANADAETELVLKLQMYSDLADKIEAVVTFGGISHADTEVSWNGNELTVIQPVASAEMTKNLRVAFSSNDANVVFAIPGTTETSVERSVVDYARAVLKSSSATQGAKDLVTHLVTYGGYAQLFFATQPGYTDVPTDYLAYNVLKELGLDIPDPSTASITDSMAVPQAFASVKQEVYLGSAISQDVIFELAEGYSFANQQLTLTYKKTFKGEEDQIELTMDNGIVSIQNIPAAFLNYDYKLEGQVVAPNGTTSHFEVTPKVTAYLGRIIDLYAAKSVQTPVTKELADLANAMWLYNQSAYAFFNQYSVAAVEETEVTE